MIPDLATAIVSKEPPRAAKCSSPTVVMTDAASPEGDITLVASRAPPSPAYPIQNSKEKNDTIIVTLAIFWFPVITTTTESYPLRGLCESYGVIVFYQ